MHELQELLHLQAMYNGVKAHQLKKKKKEINIKISVFESELGFSLYCNKDLIGGECSSSPASTFRMFIRRLLTTTSLHNCSRISNAELTLRFSRSASSSGVPFPSRWSPCVSIGKVTPVIIYKGRAVGKREEGEGCIPPR